MDSNLLKMSTDYLLYIQSDLLIAIKIYLNNISPYFYIPHISFLEPYPLFQSYIIYVKFSSEGVIGNKDLKAVNALQI